MAIKESIFPGDWVRIESSGGSVIEGQANSEIYLGGSAILSITIADDAENTQSVNINVNFWDVKVVKKNAV